jgi:hypothetical protein
MAVKGEQRDQSARSGRRFARIRPRAQSLSLPDASKAFTTFGRIQVDMQAGVKINSR